MVFIEISHLKKIYNPYSSKPKVALDDINLNIEKGDFICIMGASGSGKTTFINVLSTIDDITDGKIIINGENIHLMTDNQRSNLRKKHIGFIFQNYNLIESLVIKDNILFSLRANKVDQHIQNEQLEKISKQLGIEDILHKYPYQCSGGQQQRVAIARALITNPDIICADEPTGNLDSLNAKELMKLFIDINQQRHSTIIMVTHDNLVASYSERVFYLKDGKIDQCIEKQSKTQEQYYKDIMAVTAQMNLDSIG